jgi:hypothetical protein
MKRFWLQNAIVGLCAGICTALLLSAPSRPALALLFYSVAALPILIAAIGWNHWAGLLAAIVTVVGIAPGADPSSTLGILFGVTLPAWWLGYLTLLARTDTATGELEWYPPGRLLLWCAVLGALAMATSLFDLVSGDATFLKTLREIMLKGLRIQFQIPDGQLLIIPGIDNPDRFVDVLVIMMAPGGAMLSTLIEILDLWLAARILRISGRLKRPWPDLVAMRLPSATPLALAVALAGSFISGVPGFVAALFAGSLLFAYAVIGFAVMHDITRHLNGRAVMLIGMYATVIVLIWPVLLMGLLGLIDTALDLRARVAAARGPPTPLA